MQDFGPGLFGGLFFLVWLTMMGAIVVGYVVFLVALWRGMRAHEAISATLKNIARSLESASRSESDSATG